MSNSSESVKEMASDTLDEVEEEKMKVNEGNKGKD